MRMKLLQCDAVVEMLCSRSVALTALTPLRVRLTTSGCVGVAGTGGGGVGCCDKRSVGRRRRAVKTERRND
jgi:hypothetical protein